MGFKVLTEQQLALLSEDERHIYEQDYREYSERTNFIQKIELLENIKIPHISPRKTKVKSIRNPQIDSVCIDKKASVINKLPMVVNPQIPTVNQAVSVSVFPLSSVLIPAIDKYDFSQEYVQIDSLPDVVLPENCDISCNMAHSRIDPLNVVKICKTSELKKISVKKFSPELTNINIISTSFNKVNIGDWHLDNLPKMPIKSPQLIKYTKKAVHTEIPNVKIPCVSDLSEIQFKNNSMEIPKTKCISADSVKVKINEMKIDNVSKKVVDTPVIVFNNQNGNIQLNKTKVHIAKAAELSVVIEDIKIEKTSMMKTIQAPDYCYKAPASCSPEMHNAFIAQVQNPDCNKVIDTIINLIR